MLCEISIELKKAMSQAGLWSRKDFHPEESES